MLGFDEAEVCIFGLVPLGAPRKFNLAGACIVGFAVGGGAVAAVVGGGADGGAEADGDALGFVSDGAGGGGSAREAAAVLGFSGEAGLRAGGGL